MRIGILPRSDQKHFGHGPGECSPITGALSGAGDQSGDGALLPGMIHQVQGGIGELVGGENQTGDGFSGDPRQVSPKHPQSAYTGLQKSLQQEWAFVKRVTPGVGNAFGPV